jgi:hypothetical protein
MSSLKAVGMLVALGSIAIVTVLTLPTARAESPARTAYSRAGLAAPNSSFLAQTPPVSCTLTVTQTVGKLGNQSFDTAFLLSNADGLSLVPQTDVPPGTSVTVPAIPDYYYLNGFAGYLINVTASPSSAGGNYNLGLQVFDGNQNLIVEDSNPSDFSASVSLVANYTGRMYFRVYQLNAATACSGGYYYLQVSSLPPTPTPSPTPTPALPSFGYGMVMAGPDNLWPHWVGFNYQLVFDPPVFSDNNELMRLKVNASDLSNLFALKGRLRQIVLANASVESFQIGNEPNLASEWNSQPDALSYRAVLCAAYNAIKQVRPSAIVVSGGLAPTGRVVGTWNGHQGHDGLKQDEREYLKEFINDGGGNCLDAVGYNALGFRANYDAAPDVDGGTAETNCASGLCFRSVEQIHAIMQSRGLAKPIWATEVGWLVAPPSYCLSDSRWQGRIWQIVTPAQQADNLVGAFRYARLHWPWMKAMFVFNLDFNLAPWYDECEQMRYYSVAGQPAFLALGAVSKEVHSLYLPVVKK